MMPVSSIDSDGCQTSKSTMTAIVVVAMVTQLTAGLPLLKAQSTKGPLPPPDEVYQGIRRMALQATRSRVRIPPLTSPIDLPPTASPTTPWGVVMDWAVGNQTATLVAFSDGSANIYLSVGGGFAGGGEPMRKIARRAVAVAADAQPKMKLTNFYPLPHGNEVFFYLLTDAGVFTGSASQSELNTEQHPLSQLGDAMQEIITWYRNQGNSK